MYRKSSEIPSTDRSRRLSKIGGYEARPYLMLVLIQKIAVNTRTQHIKYVQPRHLDMVVKAAILLWLLVKTFQVLIEIIKYP